MNPRPEYIGERSSRTNSHERLLCSLCDRLATHKARRCYVDGVAIVPTDTHFCVMHLNRAATHKEIRTPKELTEYRRYRKKLRAWEEENTPIKGQIDLLTGEEVNVPT